MTDWIEREKIRYSIEYHRLVIHVRGEVKPLRSRNIILNSRPHVVT